MAKLVLTAIGRDRSGLVSALAGAVVEAGGNWLEAQMGRLAGSFAGIVLVDLADDRVPALEAAAARLGAEGVLEVTLRPADADEATPVPPGERLHVFVLGHDRPGIVREVAGTLAGLGVSIVELATRTLHAPMGDGLLFEADADVIVPSGVGEDALRTALEALSADFVVDVEVAADAAEGLPAE